MLNVKEPSHRLMPSQQAHLDLTGSSKRLADEFAKFRTRMEKLGHEVHGLDADVEKMKSEVDTALADLQELDQLLAKTIKRTDLLETAVTTLQDGYVELTKKLDQALVAAAAKPVSVAGPTGENDADDGGKKRDNPLHSAVRICLYAMMGIAPGADLPRPPSLQGVFWEKRYHKDDETGEFTEESLLRPDWDWSWTANRKGWLYRATSRIKEHGDKYSTSLSRAHLDSLPREAIDKAIGVIWKTLVRNWKLQTEDDGEEKKLTRNQCQKINNRKKAKAEAWAQMRKRVPAAASTDMDYQFQWQYQSTDESEVEDIIPVAGPAIDPETDDELEQKPMAGRAKTRKIWVSHAPAWRLKTTNETLDEVDIHVAEQRDKEASGRGNTYRPRKRGAPHSAAESSLPDLKWGKLAAIRIPRHMIDPEWLQTKKGQEFDKRRLISSDDESNREAGSGGENETGGGGVEDDCDVGPRGVSVGGDYAEVIPLLAKMVGHIKAWRTSSSICS
ncbi:hypothetical protein BV20DRAFT_1051248 [Pilatotrama ljubarskyi]|nr:hypothetical protein BV20DRAFT_1051248 [Pilatotrama ljubarskyi]